MSLVSLFLDRRREKKFLEAISGSYGPPRNQTKPIQEFRRGEVVGSVWAEFVDGRTQIRVSFNRRLKLRNGQIRFFKSFSPENLPDVCEAALECVAYIKKLQG